MIPLQQLQKSLLKFKERQQVIIRTTCTNQNGEVVIEGQGMHKILEK